MEITCPSCKSKYRIPDEKIADSANSSFSCPKCKKKVRIDTKEAASGRKDSKEEAEDYDASEKSFDFVNTGEKTALICISDIALKKTAIETLHVMGYHITDSENGRDALRSMWYHVYHLVILDEFFDTDNPDQNRVLAYLEGLNMTVRRKMVVALISRTYRTMDQMTAFQKSVNVIFNIKHMKELERQLTVTINEHRSFYRVFNEYYKKEISF
jgi:predicted Zn finger-like uncharacterized protein